MIYKKYFLIIIEIFKSDIIVVFISAGFVVISGLCPVLTDFSISKLLDIFEQNINCNIGYDYMSIAFLIVIIAIGSTLTLFINNIKYWISELASCRLSHNIENLIAEKFQVIPQKTIDDPNFLDLYENTLEKSSYAPVEIFDNLFNIVSSGIGLVGYIIILFQLNSWFVPILMIATIPIYYIKYSIQEKNFQFEKSTTNKRREIQYYYSLISDKNFSSEIRIFKLFEYLKECRNNLFLKFVEKKKKVIDKNIVYTLIVTCVTFVIMGILEFVLVNYVIFGIISISKFILYNTALISFEVNLLSLVDQVVDNSKSMNFLNYLFEFLNYETENYISEWNLKDTCNSYEIIFDDVSFKYPGSKIFSLKNVNLKIKLGEKICLVGENGSGKTTLIKLLLRIYSPTSGKILLNGIDISDYDIEDYKNIFSVIFQKFIHYFIDVKSNIIFGNINKADDKAFLNDIVNKMKLAKFIENCPNGYDTKLSKEFYSSGVEPSIGQWQKLAISRAIFRNTPFLILDEPTSSLDPVSEEEVFKVIESFSSKKTILIISHRLYNAKFADKIVLMSKGKILESGTHNDLINKKGTYFKLYSLQAKKY